jgi:IstB-like ATP binding protein
VGLDQADVDAGAGDRELAIARCRLAGAAAVPHGSVVGAGEKLTVLRRLRFDPWMWADASGVKARYRQTHLVIALGIRACLATRRVIFKTATDWVARLSEAKRQGNLETELKRLSFVSLIVVGEVGYIPFDPKPPTSCSCSSAVASLIVTSNKPFGAWGEIFGDAGSNPAPATRQQPAKSRPPRDRGPCCIWVRPV